MSPIFPVITDYKQIVEKSRLFVDEYWFENLNLRGRYKAWILTYINERYPQYADLYKQIYVNGNKGYWDELAEEIELYCAEYSISSHKDCIAKKGCNRFTALLLKNLLFIF